MICVTDQFCNMTLGSGLQAGMVTPQMMMPTVRPLSTSGQCYVETDSRQAHTPYEPLQMMKAIHVENFGGPEVLQLKTNLIVPPLTKTQVLVRVKYAGVNPVETYVFQKLAFPMKLTYYILYLQIHS